ncbi:glycine betaine ABC transporter substrate-binding protein [Candidatus Soleaferrea massiliensis]|uniref:glycine betaine ABC transporter substrate-binding protein n=1 Tax=Candidatus Soleaferrea massiliensis TaxID=1470354 RepID=UPI00058FBF8A|nr:glycine betaine ABC transporter substrate-binding protein [Candidatus Soleaferrea massiliensis]
MKKFAAILLSAALALSFTGCSSGDDKSTLKIYDGLYSEMKIIHQMVKQLVEQDTDLKVKIMDEMSPVNEFNELIKGNSDLLNCYDGTLLTTYLKYDPTDVPEGTSLYDFVNEKATAEKQVHLLDKLGINNTYAIAVPQEIADKYNLNTISDLVPVAGELTFGAEHDFFSEEGSAKYNPMIEFYGLKFKAGNPVDIGLKYSAVESGNIDVVIVYSTDGLNKKANLKILEDDKHFFPEYNGALLVRDDIFEKFKEAAPNLEEVLNKLSGIFTDEDMVNLTYACDVEGKSPQDVAKEFLQSKGLLK